MEKHKSGKSVKSYKEDIDAEKQKMTAYSNKLKANVKSLHTNIKSLQADFKSHSKELKDAANKMVEAGSRHMAAKIGKYKADIRDQLKENKEAVSHQAGNIKYFLSQTDKMRRDFKSYAHSDFWGRA